MKKLLIIFIATMLTNIFAQDENNKFTYYYSNHSFHEIADNENYIWFLTKTGVVKINKTTSEREFINDISNPTLDGFRYDLSCFAVDKDENIWFGTRDGLYFYDGTTFEKIDIKGQGLPYTYISNIFIDKKGKVWFSGQNKLGSYYEGNFKREFPFDIPDAENMRLWQFAYSQKNDEIVLLVRHKYSHKEMKVFAITDTDYKEYEIINEQFGDKSIGNIEVDNNGNIWLLTDDYELIKVDEKNITEIINLPEHSKYLDFKDMTHDKNGNLWIATEEGIFKYDGSDLISYKETFSDLITKHFYNIFFDEENNLWLFNSYGLYTFDGATLEPQNISHTNLAGMAHTTIAVDHNNNIWAGSFDRGVSMFDREEWHVIDTSNSGLPDNDIREISVDKDNSIWFGTRTKGAAKYNGKDWEIFNTQNSGLPGDSVHSIVFDSTGNVWFGTDGGIGKYDGTNWTKFFENKISYYKRNYCLSVAPDGKVWSTLSIGAAYFDESGRTIFDKSVSILDKILENIEFDNKGNVWFAAKDNLFKYDGIEVESLSLEENLSNGVGKIIFDKNWNMFGVKNHLMEYQNARIEYYDVKVFIESNAIYDIATDKDNNIWIAGTRGLAMLKGEPVSVQYDIESDNTTAIYPNPAKTSATLSFEMPQQGFADIFISDIMGNKLLTLSEKEFYTAGTHELSFKTAGLASGIYYCAVNTGAKTHVVKLIIRR